MTTPNAPQPGPVAGTWAIHAACATPKGRNLIDLLSDYPSNWENPHVKRDLQELCGACTVKTQCRLLAEENARPNSKRWFRLTDSIPYAGYPLKHYRDNLAA